jgi:hypothetical protein
VKLQDDVFDDHYDRDNNGMDHRYDYEAEVSNKEQVSHSEVVSDAGDNGSAKSPHDPEE